MRLPKSKLLVAPDYSVRTPVKASIKPYKNFFQLYTAEFIENYLSYKLLNRIHGNKPFYHLTGQEIKNKYNLDTEPDYYARNGNKVLLYEIKEVS